MARSTRPKPARTVAHRRDPTSSGLPPCRRSAAGRIDSSWAFVHLVSPRANRQRSPNRLASQTLTGMTCTGISDEPTTARVTEPNTIRCAHCRPRVPITGNLENAFGDTQVRTDRDTQDRGKPRSLRQPPIGLKRPNRNGG
jgi:hypothetical protein